MTTEKATGRQLLLAGVMLLALLFGLGTIFVGVVTAAEAWKEHAQAKWPVVQAHVDRCDMVQSSSRRRNMYSIRCRLNYTVGSEQNTARVYSASVPSADVSQYPPNQIGPYLEWMDEHPPGSTVMVRYDPEKHTKIVQAGDYMPRGGPRTPSNLKLLAVTAGVFLVLLAIAWGARQRRVDD